MILVDANLLVYAKIRSMPQHKKAYQWLDEALVSVPRIGLPWPSLLAFVRIVSNPRVFSQPLSIEAAWQQVEEWLALPSTWIPLPSDQHATLLRSLMACTVSSKLVPDAHLAALALEHGLELLSTDGDFARFPRLRWRNPLS